MSEPVPPRLSSGIVPIEPAKPNARIKQDEVDFRGLHQQILNWVGYSSTAPKGIHPAELNPEWLRQDGFQQPIVVLQDIAYVTALQQAGAWGPKGLAQLDLLARTAGEDTEVQTLDITRQTSGPRWSLRQWCLYWRDRDIPEFQPQNAAAAGISNTLPVSGTLDLAQEDSAAAAHIDAHSGQSGGADDEEDEADSAFVGMGDTDLSRAKEPVRKGIRDTNKRRLLALTRLPYGNHDRLAMLLAPPVAVRMADMMQPDIMKQQPSVLPDMQRQGQQLHMSVYPTGSATNFRLNPTGAAAWVHVLEGKMVFALVPFTEHHLGMYVHWVQLEARERGAWFPDACTEVMKVEVPAGHSLLIPAGWLVATAATADTLTLTSHFLCLYSLRAHMACWDAEEVHLELKPALRFPSFKPALWQLSLHYSKMLRTAAGLPPARKPLPSTSHQTGQAHMTASRTQPIIWQTKDSAANRAESTRKRVQRERTPDDDLDMGESPAQKAAPASALAAKRAKTAPLSPRLPKLATGTTTVRGVPLSAAGRPVRSTRAKGSVVKNALYRAAGRDLDESGFIEHALDAYDDDMMDESPQGTVQDALGHDLDILQPHDEKETGVLSAGGSAACSDGGPVVSSGRRRQIPGNAGQTALRRSRSLKQLALQDEQLGLPRRSSGRKRLSHGSDHASLPLTKESPALHDSVHLPPTRKWIKNVRHPARANTPVGRNMFAADFDDHTSEGYNDDRKSDSAQQHASIGYDQESAGSQTDLEDDLSVELDVHARDGRHQIADSDADAPRFRRRLHRPPQRFSPTADNRKHFSDHQPDDKHTDTDSNTDAPRSRRRIRRPPQRYAGGADSNVASGNSADTDSGGDAPQSARRNRRPPQQYTQGEPLVDAQHVIASPVGKSSLKLKIRTAGAKLQHGGATSGFPSSGIETAPVNVHAHAASQQAEADAATLQPTSKPPGLKIKLKMAPHHQQAATGNFPVSVPLRGGSLADQPGHTAYQNQSKAAGRQTSHAPWPAGHQLVSQQGRPDAGTTYAAAMQPKQSIKIKLGRGRVSEGGTGADQADNNIPQVDGVGDTDDDGNKEQGDLPAAAMVLPLSTAAQQTDSNAPAVVATDTGTLLGMYTAPKSSTVTPELPLPPVTVTSEFIAYEKPASATVHAANAALGQHVPSPNMEPSGISTEPSAVADAGQSPAAACEQHESTIAASNLHVQPAAIQRSTGWAESLCTKTLQSADEDPLLHAQPMLPQEGTSRPPNVTPAIQLPSAPPTTAPAEAPAPAVANQHASSPSRPPAASMPGHPAAVTIGHTSTAGTGRASVVAADQPVGVAIGRPLANTVPGSTAATEQPLAVSAGHGLSAQPGAAKGEGRGSARPGASMQVARPATKAMKISDVVPTADKVAGIVALGSNRDRKAPARPSRLEELKREQEEKRALKAAAAAAALQKASTTSSVPPVPASNAPGMASIPVGGSASAITSVPFDGIVPAMTSMPYAGGAVSAMQPASGAPRAEVSVPVASADASQILTAPAATLPTPDIAGAVPTTVSSETAATVGVPLAAPAAGVTMPTQPAAPTSAIAQAEVAAVSDKAGATPAPVIPHTAVTPSLTNTMLTTIQVPATGVAGPVSAASGLTTPVPASLPAIKVHPGPPHPSKPLTPPASPLSAGMGRFSMAQPAHKPPLQTGTTSTTHAPAAIQDDRHIPVQSAMMPPPPPGQATPRLPAPVQLSPHEIASLPLLAATLKAWLDDATDDMHLWMQAGLGVGRDASKDLAWLLDSLLEGIVAASNCGQLPGLLSSAPYNALPTASHPNQQSPPASQHTDQHTRPERQITAHMMNAPSANPRVPFSQPWAPGQLPRFPVPGQSSANAFVVGDTLSRQTSMAAEEQPASTALPLLPKQVGEQSADNSILHEWTAPSTLARQGSGMPPPALTQRAQYTSCTKHTEGSGQHNSTDTVPPEDLPCGQATAIPVLQEQLLLQFVPPVDVSSRPSCTAQSSQCMALTIERSSSGALPLLGKLDAQLDMQAAHTQQQPAQHSQQMVGDTVAIMPAAAATVSAPVQHTHAAKSDAIPSTTAHPNKAPPDLLAPLAQDESTQIAQPLLHPAEAGQQPTQLWLPSLPPIIEAHPQTEPWPALHIPAQLPPSAGHTSATHPTSIQIPAQPLVPMQLPAPSPVPVAPLPPPQPPILLPSVIPPPAQPLQTQQLLAAGRRETLSLPDLGIVPKSWMPDVAALTAGLTGGRPSATPPVLPGASADNDTVEETAETDPVMNDGFAVPTSRRRAGSHMKVGGSHRKQLPLGNKTRPKRSLSHGDRPSDSKRTRNF